jgi:hypothetical protein
MPSVAQERDSTEHQLMSGVSDSLRHLGVSLNVVLAAFHSLPSGGDVSFNTS